MGRSWWFGTLATLRGSCRPGREALDRALGNIVDRFSEGLAEEGVKVDAIVDVMRRFLRVRTTLVRAFPIHQHDELEPHLAVRSMLDSQDASGLSWREKFRKLLEFLLRQCSPQERWNYLEAAERTQTGRIRVVGRVDRLGCKAEMPWSNW